MTNTIEVKLCIVTKKGPSSHYVYDEYIHENSNKNIWMPGHNRKVNRYPGNKLKLLSYLTVMSALRAYPKQNEVKE